MKFLCDNCKAKYQIPDEKIAGRTLRMKCRKCDHEIILKGPKDEADAGPTEGSNASKKRSGSSVGPAPRPGARKSSSQAGPRPTSPVAAATQPKRASSLGSEFRKGSLAPEAPSPRAPAAEWYVAINDVPVGPIKRDEVARKIGLGAVTAESLCWREGLDDWKPVGQVPELASLLQQRRVPPPPTGSSVPPPRASERPSNNVVPIGGRLGAAAAPAYDEGELEDERTVMAPVPVAEPEPVRAKPTPKPAPKPVVAPKPAATPKPVAAPKPVVAPRPVAAPQEEDDPFALPIAASAAPMAPAPVPVAAPAPFAAPPASIPAPAPRRGIPVGAWIAIVGAGAFGITLALAIGPKLLSDDPAPVAEATPVPDPVTPTEPTPELELDVPDPVPEEVVPEEVVPEETTTSMRSTSTSMTVSAMTSTTTAMTDNLTDEQRRQLELLTMSGATGAAPSMLSVGGGSTTTTAREELDNDAVRRVVTAQSNQLALRRCYEVAIRGMPEAPAVRLDVEVVVGASGTVTRASAAGNDVGSLKNCVETTVRRWRFPPSSNGGRAQFPVVFSGGG